MPSSSNPSSQTTSKDITRAKGSNTALFLKSSIANLALDIIEGIMNLKVYVQQASATGTVPAVRATVVRSPTGITISIPVIATSASGTGGVLNMFQTVECFGDYFTAYMVSNGIPGTILFLIAKPYNLRASLTEETFDGNLVTYDYSIDDGTGNYRTATLGDTAETQVMIPRYKPSTVDSNQDIIFAALSTGTGVNEVDNQVDKWLEIKPARMWAKQYSS